MNGLSKRLVSLTMATAMVFSLTAVPATEASAATKTITAKTTSVQAGQTYTYSINAKKAKNVKISVSGAAKSGVTATVDGKKLSGKTLKGGKTLKVTIKANTKVVGKKFVVNYKLDKKATKKTKAIKVNYSAKSVSLDQTALTLEAGKTATLKATINPTTSNSTIKSWVSSDEKVATVNNGVVTAVAAGTADITVTTSNGKTAKATVTVEEKKEDEKEVTKFGITAKATKADTIVVTADKELSSAATVVVTKEGLTTPVASASVTPNGNEITFVSKTNFTVGNYTVKVTDGKAEAETAVSIQERYIADIVIKSEKALLGLQADGTTTDDKTAYVYYDVVDQYGESMRTSTSIEWTTSAAGGVTAEDRSTGKLTISAGGGANDKFTYGNPLYVVGVDAKSGKTVQKNLTIGLAQSLDSVKAVGFVNSLDVATKLSDVAKTLPSDFSKNAWYLVYETYDQEGNIIDGVGDNVQKSRVTLVSDNFTLLKIGTSNDANYEKTFTIEGVVYSAILVQPGLYVDKGGEVNITAISNKTGKQTVMNFPIGTGAILKKITLEAPARTVADGDQNVELGYTAVDTNGNTVTNYETIVRSTNTLSLSATEGTLCVKENNDGTAKILWSDALSYAPLSAGTNAYAKSTAYDNVARPIALTTTVVGGEASTLMLQVSDTRRPVAITSVNYGATTYAEADTFGFRPYSYWWDNAAGRHVGSVEYIDQYNDVLDNKVAVTFFERTKNNLFNGYLYAIKVDVEAISLLGNTSADGDVEASDKDDTIMTPNSINNDWNNAFTGVIYESNNQVTSKNIKYSIVQAKTAGKLTAEDASDAGKILSMTYDYVPVTKLSNITMGNISTQQATTGAEGYANGALAGLTISGNRLSKADETYYPTSVNFNTNKTKDSDVLKVTGTYKGSTVTVPYSYITADDSVFVVDFNGKDGGMRIKTVSGDAITWADLYDVNSNHFARKVASKTMKVTVAPKTDKVGILATPSITVKVSDEPSYVAKIKLYKGENQTINPKNTNVVFDKVSDSIDGIYKIAWDNVEVLDQYDNDLAANAVLSYTLTDVKEASTELTHVANSLQVSGSGTTSANLTGAEIGDTFKLTITATLPNVNSMSVDANITIGADKQAAIYSGLDGETDKTFRKTCLHYDR